MPDSIPEDKMEIVFDEILWNLLESAQNHNLSAEQVQTVLKAINGFCYHENFDSFYEEKFNASKEQFKTIYARAFNIQRYLIEADQEQDG